MILHLSCWSSIPASAIVPVSKESLLVRFDLRQSVTFHILVYIVKSDEFSFDQRRLFKAQM